MSAFGEDAGADTAQTTELSTAEADTDEVVSTYEADDEEIKEPELTDEEKAHNQKYLRRYDLKESDGCYKLDSLNLDELWDWDTLNIRVLGKPEADVGAIKAYFASKSGAWDDIPIKELDFLGTTDRVDIGTIRSNYYKIMDLNDAYLKLTVEDMSAVQYASLKIDSVKDTHKYDEWIKKTDRNGNTKYTFYARNYDKDYSETYCGLYETDLWVHAGDFEDKYVDAITFDVEIDGEVTLIMMENVDNEWREGSGLLSKTGSYGGSVGTSRYGDYVHFMLHKAAAGSKITLNYVKVYALDYAGKVDESIDVSVPYTLKNASPFHDGFQYDVSMLPAIGGKFIVEFDPAESSNGLRLNNYIQDYTVDRKVPVDQGETTAEIYVTSGDMEILRKGTMRLDSENLNITKVSFVETPVDPKNFQYGDNKCDITLDSKQEYVWIPGSAFEKLTPKGTAPVTITFETDSSVSDPWVQYRFGTTDLHRLTDAESVKGKTTFECELYTNVTTVKKHGLYIYGNGITITNVNINKGNPWTGDGGYDYVELTADKIKDVELISAPDDESVYTSPLNGFGVNKMYSQKNELGDGTYNQRFLMQVKTADVADVECYGIIVSSGDKHVYINCYGLSSSITINGNSIKADEGCVFLSAAVVGVNDDITLSYSEFVYD